MKEILKELCKVSRTKRADFIINFLKENNIIFNLYKNSNNLNIEVVKQGIIKQKSIIFFSHYDISSQTQEGANDNSSSVAVLLNIAKYLNFNSAPYYTLKLVFNDNEEILGGLGLKSYSIQKVRKLVINAGSFQYLSDIKSKNDIAGIFILELSGIGDSIFIASLSGNIKCDKGLNDFLIKTAEDYKFMHIVIPVPLSDMISVNINKFKGTVFGAIPYLEGKNFLENVKEKGFKKDIFPYIWQRNHTNMDNIYSIQEKSLEMTFNFLKAVIKNLGHLEKT